jgi:hypothetical protein
VVQRYDCAHCPWKAIERLGEHQPVDHGDARLQRLGLAVERDHLRATTDETAA